MTEQEYKQPKWISVEDRLPEMYQHCLIWTTNADGDMSHRLAYWNGNKSWFLVNGGYKDKDATHWMPLPQPPQEKDDG